MRSNLFLVLLFFSLSLLLQAGAIESEIYLQGIRYFDEKAYKKALPLLQKLAKKGNKGAMYRLAYLYENGLGTPKNLEKATYWYKKAAQNYAYTIQTEGAKALYSRRFAKRLKAQLTPYSTRAAGLAALAKVDTQTPETKQLFEDLTSGHFFGLTPYKANYLLPVGIADRKYRRQPSGYKSFEIFDAVNHTHITPLYGTYDKQTEVEFQFSLKKNLTYNLLGLGEYITAAYTQHCFWQLYAESGPFRETNYMPEIFATFPTSAVIDEVTGLKATKWGFIHQSNGQEGYRSRSWNRLYVQGMFQWSNLFLSARVWYRLPEEDKSDDYYRGYVDVNHNGRPDPGDRLVDPNSESDKDDNPDILDYLGYGDLAFTYLWGNHQFDGLLRYNFHKGGKDRGAIQLDWSYPFFHSRTTFWYLKLFSGYGESLIDYNRNVTKASFGFSFSRGIFQ